jgi:uncharacterized protein involved in exopolysaccharide biosynthesis
MENSVGGLNLYWGIIKQGKWLIILGTVGCMAVVGLISFLLPPIYESSMIIEVGQIYPVPEEGIKKETELIEEPMAMAAILGSDEFLDNTRKKLKLNLTLEKMRQRLSVEQIVELTRFQRSESTLIRVTWEDPSPRLSVEVLDSLANQLIEQHDRIYRIAIKNFSERIVSLEGKITSSEKVIATQNRYRKVMGERMCEVETGIVDYEKIIKGLNFDKANMNELLFFKASLNSLKEQLIDVETEINEADLNIGEQEEKIQEARDWIANINGYIGLSRNTEIRSQPVLPDEPIKPDKGLNIIMAGLLGILITMFFVFFSHYTKSE